MKEQNQNHEGVKQAEYLKSIQLPVEQLINWQLLWSKTALAQETTKIKLIELMGSGLYQEYFSESKLKNIKSTYEIFAQHFFDFVTTKSGESVTELLKIFVSTKLSSTEKNITLNEIPPQNAVESALRVLLCAQLLILTVVKDSVGDYRDVVTLEAELSLFIAAFEQELFSSILDEGFLQSENDYESYEISLPEKMVLKMESLAEVLRYLKKQKYRA
jgi:hypothetical protein